MDLNSARIFVAVVNHGSFSSAARHIGIPVATVSRRVAELEKSLDVRLLERSTRQLRLTEAGQALYSRAARGVEEMEAAVLAINERENELRGKLRLSIPPSFRPMWSLLSSFQRDYPFIQIEIVSTEQHLEFVEDNIDIALRIGELANQSAIARPLPSYRHRLVTTPSYLADKEITTPQELSTHATAAWGKQYRPIKWSLGEYQIDINPLIRSNDYEHLLYLVQEGNVITELPEFLCQHLLDEGKLVEVLADYKMPERSVNLLYPTRKGMSRITRVFIDFCLANLDANK